MSTETTQKERDSKKAKDVFFDLMGLWGGIYHQLQGVKTILQEAEDEHCRDDAVGNHIMSAIEILNSTIIRVNTLRSSLEDVATYL